MSELLNSIWPNGVKKDADGYSVYYPLGTNKIDIPDGSKWPKGTKLKFPFVYDENGQLTGFCDTKSMIANSGTNIYLPYEEIKADFSSINKGTLGIHAPNATIKKAIWKDSEEEDISEIQFKYKGCKTYIDVNTRNHNTMYNYLASLSQNSWSEPLWDLTDGYGLFASCANLISFTSELPSLMSGKRMFYDCSNLSSFDSDLSTLKSGYEMFADCANLTSFSSDLSSLTEGYSMFENCSELTSFNCDDLSSLTNGDYMFNECFNLTAFNADLNYLTNGKFMFYNCSELTTFNCSDLSSLTNGEFMFENCKNLESFSADLSSLTIGSSMFWGCENLKYVDSNMKNLTNGYWMFEFCYNLTTFTSDLSSLTKGDCMFRYCKLDAPSVKNIIDTINTYPGQLSLGMGCNNTTEDKDLFAQEVGYVDMTSLLAALQAKRWTVEAQYTGRPTITYGLRRPSADTLPIFVQLEETEDHANYTSLDDSKKYRLNWFHETTGSTEGYTQFNSLEEAIETFNIKQIERN